MRRTSRVTGTAVTAAIFFASAQGVAFADVVENTVKTTGANANDSFVAGGSTSIAYSIDGKNNDGLQGCNAVDGSDATLTISVPVGVTVTGSTLLSGNRLSFNSCGSAQSVTFSATSAGSYAITHSVADSGAGTYDAAAADWMLVVTPAASVNKTPQTITFAEPTPAEQQYGSTASFTAPTASSALPTTVAVSGACESTPSGIVLTALGTCTLVASQSGDATYAAATNVERTITVIPKVLTGAISASDKQYDGTTAASVTPQALSGVVGSESVTLLASNGSFNTAAVGDDKPVTADVSLSGDDAGNYTLSSASASTTADILAWSSGAGFKSPVSMDSRKVNQLKAGSTVPLKFNVYAGNTGSNEQTTVAAVKRTSAKQIVCETTDTSVPVDAAAVTGQTSLRYDFDQFVFNWKAPATVGCYRVAVVLADDSTIMTDFKVTK